MSVGQAAACLVPAGSCGSTGRGLFWQGRAGDWRARFRGNSVCSVQCVMAATRTKLQSPQPTSQVPILNRFLSMHALSGRMAGMDA